MDWHKKHYLVWGLGRTGLSTIRYFAKNKVQVTAIEQRAKTSCEQVAKEFEGSSVQILWEYPQDSEKLPEVDEILLSPGVPYDRKALVHARSIGIPTTAAIAWAAQFVKVPIVAVTGSAGKSTTVSLIGEMLKASGLDTFVGGNIGTPLIDLIAGGQKVDRVVIECSSFQLEASPALKAEVAVLTNLYPNHLDRHGSIEEYGRCKSQLFQAQDKNAWCITRGNDPDVLPVIESSAAQTLFFFPTGKSDFGVMLKDDAVCLRLPNQQEELYPLTNLRLRGEHNHENVMVAVLASRLSGASKQGIQEGLESFGGLPHRQQEVFFARGVHYINDSKATTAAASVQAIKASSELGAIRLLLGGRSKGDGLQALDEVLDDRIAKIYLFGEAALEFADHLKEKSVEIASYEKMESALLAAHQESKESNVILLSPACTSFDQFLNFEKRGIAFTEWVLKHCQE